MFGRTKESMFCCTNIANRNGQAIDTDTTDSRKCIGFDASKDLPKIKILQTPLLGAQLQYMHSHTHSYVGTCLSRYTK